ncbi:hypothetical protein Pelo_7494 [Pelomyxa schiedti]|nr:hypothetical protein Pelo_7494 [Pelomyxa schiedti]
MTDNISGRFFVGSYVYLTARAQVLALVVSSHPRCGAPSPLRGLVTPALSSQLWDICCAGPGAETHFCILVLGLTAPTMAWEHPHDKAEDVLLRMSVSTLTGGVTRAPSVAHRWGVGDFKAVLRILDYGLVGSGSFIQPVMSGRVRAEGMYRFAVVDREGNEKRWLMDGPADRSFVSAARKWWVHFCVNSLVMTVACLWRVDPRQTAAESPVQVRLPLTDIVMGSGGHGVRDWRYREFFFSRTDPDEAVALFQSQSSGRYLLFVVIDIKRTHGTKSLAVVHSSLEILPFDARVLEVLSFRCPRTNQLTFIVLVRTGGYSLQVCTIANGNVTELTGCYCGGVSQLNQSQFCVVQRDVYEIWDCNNLMQPPRSFPHVIGSAGGAVCEAESGFIFHSHERACVIAVTDAFNRTVLTLHFAIASDKFHKTPREMTDDSNRFFVGSHIFLSARAQVLALVVASHPRCGALSPLRGLVTPALSSQLWDICCAGPGAETHFCILVSGVSGVKLVFGDGADNVEDVLMRMSVSSLTGGVTRAPSVAHRWGIDEYGLSLRIDRYGIVDSDSFVKTSVISGSSTGDPEDSDEDDDESLYRFSVADRSGNEKRWLMDGLPGNSFVSAARKWWVHIGAESLVMTVVGLQGLPAAESAVGVSMAPTPEVIMGSGGHSEWSLVKFALSRNDPDEATILFGNQSSPRSLLFMVIDITSTHKTKSLVVVDSSVGTIPVDGRVLEMLAFRCPHTNKRTFVVEILSEKIQVSATGSRSITLYHPVFSVVDGNVSQLCEDFAGKQLSQLNELQFCVTQRDVYEVWDCKDLTEPTRSFPHVVGSTDDAGRTPKVQAESGFIFHSRGCAQAIAVTDPSDVTVAILNFASEIQRFTVFNSV